MKTNNPLLVYTVTFQLFTETFKNGLTKQERKYGGSPGRHTATLHMNFSWVIRTITISACTCPLELISDRRRVRHKASGLLDRRALRVTSTKLTLMSNDLLNTRGRQKLLNDFLRPRPCLLRMFVKKIMPISNLDVIKLTAEREMRKRSLILLAN